MKFYFQIPEVHIQYVVVEADDADAARELVMEGQYENAGPAEYSHNSDEIEQVEEDEVPTHLMPTMPGDDAAGECVIK